MDIYEALTQDHRKVMKCLDELVLINDSDNIARNKLVGEIRDLLVPHSRAEEAVLYNSIRAIHADDGSIMHGFKEHLEAETLLRALQVETKTHISWKETANKLRDALNHHIQEEEDRIYKLCQKIFTEEESVKLREAFEALKPKIKDESFMKNSMELIANLLPPRLTGQGKELKAG